MLPTIASESACLLGKVLKAHGCSDDEGFLLVVESPYLMREPVLKSAGTQPHSCAAPDVP